MSCDIVGHSGESGLEIQRDRIAAINELVGHVMASSGEARIIWASGGDGGHVAFGGTGLARQAVDLIVALRRWSASSGVPLRVVASRGVASCIDGADGRPQLVGHGINFAGRLLQRGDDKNVVVSHAFRETVESADLEDVQFHDESVIELPYFGAQKICVLTVTGEFRSFGVTSATTDDRVALEAAIRRTGTGLEALYRAKRLLQLNPDDRQATDALVTLAERRDLAPESADVAELILDRDFGTDFIRGAHLVERRQGELICRHGEEGATMFLVLRGELGGFAKLGPEERTEIAAPDFKFEPGALVGELAFALKRPRTATIWSLQDAALLAFSYADLVNSSVNDDVRHQLEEAVNRTIRARIVEHVGRTAPYLAGVGGPLDDTEATWLKLRRGSRLISRKWREHPRLTPESESIGGHGLCLLVSGALESTTGSGRRLDGNDQPLVYVDLPGEMLWRTAEYALGGDVMLLVVHHDVLLEFGPTKYREIVARVQDHLDGDGEPQQQHGAAERARDAVFVSYSHADRAYLDMLKTHLEPYVRDRALTLWSDETIAPGARWLQELETALASCSVAVLLVSPKFLASRFITTRELPPILRAAEEEGLTIVWIPVSDSAYEQTAIRDYQAAHDPSRPLDSLRTSDRNKALVKICRAIGEVAGRASPVSKTRA